ncbi:hypothetical protein O181_043704 [Austropuccinia psidii MF-1]|uniref:Uncharacterized protein n=1 Tax=Austropuccinia psidii MF-1 TaxID=1389203 RepID=A0A9Q3DIK6_9BASI|nr:hypothetical protein [Austropuccinia psidii MF-1]
MTTRRESQYFIQSDGCGLRSTVDPSKGVRKGQIPSGTESTQVSSISKMQFPDMSMISEPELELSMSNSHRDKSHFQGSNRHLYEPLQAVLHSVQGHRLENVATNPPRSDELLAYPEKLVKEEEIVRYSNGWNPLSSKPQIKRIKEYHYKKKEGRKEEAPVPSTRKPQANQLPIKGRRTRKGIGGNHIPQVTGSQKSKKMPWTRSSTGPEP